MLVAHVLRPAGVALNLPPALVRHIGEELQAGRPMDDRVIRSEADQQIFDGVQAALTGAMLEQLAPVAELARGPSFNLKYPKIPGRDLEGVPNADSPELREKLRQRLLRDPDGLEELPGFLKGA